MSQRNATNLATRADGQPKIIWLNVDSPRPHRGGSVERLQRLRLLHNLVCLLGASGAILERDEAGVEDFGVDQLQVDVGESGEDRLPARAAEYQREHG